MRLIRIIFLGVAVSAALQAAANVDCARLIDRKFSAAEIKSAEHVANGALALPSPLDAPAAATRALPAFCRVAGTIRPTADSEIHFELWLPDRWNGRFLQSGNGGFAGAIRYDGMVQGLGYGFAVANTDDGHTGHWTDASWAPGHPEKVIDFGYRAVHLTAIAAKAIVNAYYPQKFSHAYFSGCSDGGRESLMEAQRYSDDFDGWLVGAPANNFTALMTYFLHTAQVLAALSDPLTPSQLEVLSKKATAACDASDGVVDGVIDSPLQCKFDPAELSCTGAPDGSCLSKSQLQALRELYDDVRGGKEQTTLISGLQASRGTESVEWPVSVVGPVPEVIRAAGMLKPGAPILAENFWRFMVYDDSKWDLGRLDVLRAFNEGHSRVGTLLNSVDPDLSALRAAGKKIIQYHGWADSFIPAQQSIAYYEAVEKYLSRDNRDFYRLFMVPGMTHCGGGPGPNMFGAAYAAGDPFDAERNALAALVQWVEKGQAPQRIIATKYQDDDQFKAVVRTRPLCAYPQAARWTGRGSTDDAKNFRCQ